jgi:hypothetical protein
MTPDVSDESCAPAAGSQWRCRTRWRPLQLFERGLDARCRAEGCAQILGLGSAVIALPPTVWAARS